MPKKKKKEINENVVDRTVRHLINVNGIIVDIELDANSKDLKINAFIDGNDYSLKGTLEEVK